MKTSLLSTVVRVILIGAGALFFSSCVDEENGNAPVLTGNSIFVPNSTDSPVTAVLSMDADWKIENESQWFSVTPLSGSAGDTEITITVYSINSNLKERLESFIVNCGGNSIQYYVIQAPTPGFNIGDVEFSVLGDATALNVPVESNIAYTVVPDVDWITVEDVVVTDSTQLEDGVTWSKYKGSVISVNVSANSGDVRKGTVSLVGEDGVTTSSFSVTQEGTMSAEYSRTFIRRSLVIKFTADWCQYCPTMSTALDNAAEAYPDHIIHMNMYALNSLDADLVYPRSPTFESIVGGVSSYPTAAVNYYAKVMNRTQEVFENLAHEATEQLPANTVLGGRAMLDDEKKTVSVNLSVASKTAEDYTLCVFLLEDGIIGYQMGSATVYYDYEHNNVVLTEMTDKTKGDEISLEKEGSLQVSYSLPLPSVVTNPDNLHIVAYTLRYGSFTGENTIAEYINSSYIVDNVVDIPVGTFVNFGYEE